MTRARIGPQAVRYGVTVVLRRSTTSLSLADVRAQLQPRVADFVAAEPIVLENEVTRLVEEGLVVRVIDGARMSVRLRWTKAPLPVGFMVKGRGERRSGCLRYETCLGAFRAGGQGHCPELCSAYAAPHPMEAFAMAMAAPTRSALGRAEDFCAEDA